MKEYLGEFITGLITSLCGLGAWLNERKQRKLQNNQSIMDLYQEALDDLKKRYDEKYEDLKKEFESFKSKYKSLKIEFDNYKKLQNSKK